MNIEQKYKKYNNKKIFIILATLMLVMIIALCSLTYATSSSLFDALKAVINYCLGIPFCGENASTDKVLVLLRLPRICLAILAGIGLAVSGLMMQSVTRNFLVSPFTLGVSSSAAFGASLCIVFGNDTIFFNDFLI